MQVGCEGVTQAQRPWSPIFCDHAGETEPSWERLQSCAHFRVCVSLSTPFWTLRLQNLCSHVDCGFIQFRSPENDLVVKVQLEFQLKQTVGMMPFCAASKS